jgi:hypothetical protein
LKARTGTAGGQRTAKEKPRRGLRGLVCLLGLALP